MDKNLLAETRLRLDEIDDLAHGLGVTKEREVRDRTELVRRAIGVPATEETKMQGNTGTGEQAADYQALYDKPDEVVMAEQGWPLVVVWSVKNAMANAGLALKYPAPANSHQGWHDLGPDAVPADWAGPNKYKHAP